MLREDKEEAKLWWSQAYVCVFMCVFVLKHCFVVHM